MDETKRKEWYTPYDWLDAAIFVLFVCNPWFWLAERKRRKNFRSFRSHSFSWLAERKWRNICIFIFLIDCIKWTSYCRSSKCWRVALIIYSPWNNSCLWNSKEWQWTQIDQTSFTATSIQHASCTFLKDRQIPFAFLFLCILPPPKLFKTETSANLVTALWVNIA